MSAFLSICAKNAHPQPSGVSLPQATLKRAGIRQQFVACHTQNLSDHLQLYIRHKPLSALYTLDCVFVHIQARTLQHIRKRPLGGVSLHLFP
jgi:hypothetical protein